MGNFIKRILDFRYTNTNSNFSLNKSNLSEKSYNFLEEIKNNNRNKIQKLKENGKIFQTIEFEIINNSIKLIRDNLKDNLLHLEFKFKSQINIMINIYMNATYDSDFNFKSDVINYLKIENDDEKDLLSKNIDNNSFKYYKGQKNLFSQGNYIIDLDSLPYDNLVNITEKFPLIIEVIPFYKNDKNITTSYGFVFPKITKYMFLIEFDKLNLEGKIFFEGIKINDKVIKLEKVSESNMILDYKSCKTL